MTFGSLFAGIGGFDLGLERAGLRCAWQVEINPQCRKLLAAKFPRAARHDDVRTVGAHNLAPVDVICGGFPCQDLSIAGRRAGLAGSRSGLFYELTRITHELQAAFLLWENVPGLLTSDRGRDFMRVLVELVRIGYHGAWRVLDAQYFGVAQRRRRVFGLFARGDTGAERCAEILSLAEGVRGHPAPRRQAWQKPASTLTRSALCGGSPCGGDGRDGLLISGTLAGGARKKSGYSTDNIPLTCHTLSAGRDGYNDGSDQIYIPIVSPALKARDGKGPSSDGDGDGAPLICAFDATQITSKTNRSRPRAPVPVIAFSSKDHGADAGELASTPRAMAHRDSHPNGGGQLAIAQTLTAEMYRSGGATAGNNIGVRNVLLPAVRRLTPRECERLQGFPDDWTAGFVDATRYRMLGNAVAVPCAEWIGRRLARHFSHGMEA